MHFFAGSLKTAAKKWLSSFEDETTVEVKYLIFRLKLGFLEKYSQIMFFNTIRSFDVVSELY